jgi:hypothetical protein
MVDACGGRRNADLLQQVEGTAPRLVMRDWQMRPDRLDDLIAHLQQRMERGQRILEYGTDPAAAKRAHCVGRKRVDPLVGRRATSRWRRLAVAANASEAMSLLALEPVPGRSHQLRAHLAWLGVPIVGDRLYARGGSGSHGSPAAGGPLALCAVAIDFPHPHDCRRIALAATVPAVAPWTFFDTACYAVGSSADPLQQVNRWDDPSLASVRSDLIADLWDHQPVQQQPLLPVEAPV